ncbi:TIGR01457 family HAD-type hydrolase [Paenibacillus aurantius]|uniref:TIGR01457 family HAD-type hydrolase n=1 Tax=Paenibacillus aurantius TaxID=2918900 RepID=A0AA96LF64_9BACL|nr:TIGR01457 family HAD-type hydrolase [Paenibacillus aurantius]WNQ12757.1 TIGR01457 family HAD-type hydrolase [Paenibacillus aurantius]
MPGFLIDLDGTMYAGTQPIEHAKEFIGELRRRSLPFLFVTNNSSRVPAEVAAHLRDIAGVEAREEEIFTSSQAAARYVADRKPGARVAFIGEAGLEQALAGAGLQLTEEAPDYVVQGIDRAFSYAKLEAALRHLLNGASYVQTNPDLLLPTERGLTPGAGALGASLAAAAGVEPVVIGKPSPVIMRYAIERLGLAADDIWVVGDNLRTDIGGGAAAGCRTALVLTGVATPANYRGQIETLGIRPDVTALHLEELLRLLG